jgi:hypothetical protein
MEDRADEQVDVLDRDQGVAHRVGGMRCQGEREARLVPAGVAHGESRLQVAVRIGGVGRREIEHHQAQHRTHARLEEGAGAGIGKEIHVVAAGDATPEHLAAARRVPS